jgi:ketosteroid isomerase-like protein
MSGENVAIVREVFELWNAGDRRIRSDYLDPAVELESPLSSVSGEPYRGHAGVEQWIRDVDEQFAEFESHLDAVREVENTVVAIGTIQLKGRTSGVALDQPAAWIVRFGADHRVKYMRIYLQVDEALRAVGLEG